MKRVIKTFTFWLIIISIIIIIFSIAGLDDKNILIIGLNPLMYILAYTEPFRSAVWVNDSPSMLMYAIYLVSFIICGGIIDSVIYSFKYIIKNIKEIR